ncbi:Mu transposase C-terminal domain-containing protein [Desulfovibrio aminophilus]|uniref:Mu transposase C-terminal domain-containing protein n=1 Tax=Desulfovibrio aminophilus TaxID=81425 RepID=UPI000488FCB9|nr:Mu transposase C-terminal domain-containing protein [Desulfovibrio aminophilus]
MSTIKESYSSTELSGLLDRPVRAVHRMATRESWKSRPRAGRGGGREWLVASMPEATRLAIRVAEQKALAETSPALAVAQLPAAPGAPVPAQALDAARRAKALAKADLIRLYLEWQRRHGATVAAKRDFVEAYLAGGWPNLLDALGKVSWQSLERWKVAQERQGSVLVLADRRGLAHRGQSVLTDEHRRVLLRTALNPNSPAISVAVREAGKIMRAQGLSPIPSEATMRRFLDRYIGECHQTWVMVREGTKAWNDKCAWSIRRDWSLINVGDVLIADGHTLNFESINPATGKPCRMTLLMWFDGASNYPVGWEVMATENVQCIAAAFRRACIALGKTPKVAYLDNGKAFRARFFSGVADFRQCGIASLLEDTGTTVGMNGLYDDLDMHVVHAQPYHGQSKPVERFFGTLHELEVWSPSYTGNCIDAKPARMKRGEDVHRRAYAAMGGRPLTLEETYKALALWFDEYVRRPSRAAHLRGRAPIDVFSLGVGPGVDLARLDLLMLSKEVKGITKHGVSLRGRHYYHPMLSDRRHKCVVRYDPQEPDTILVYDTDGKFMCEARTYGAEHPMAAILGTPEQQASLQQKLAYKAEQKKLVASTAGEMLKRVVLPEAQRRLETLEAVKAVEARRAALPSTPQARPLDAAEAAALERVRSGQVTPMPVKQETPQEIDARWKRLDARIASGEAVTEQEKRWHQTYPNTSGYRAMRTMERIYGARVAQAN